MLAVAIRDIGSVVVAATVAGVGVTLIFSLALLGSVRGGEARNAGRPALHWFALQILATIGVIVSVVWGVYIVSDK